MPSSRRGLLFLFLAAALGVCIGGPGLAQPIQAGKDYRVLARPQAVATPNRVEVIEFFFYPCPYCNELAPAIERWRKRLSPDVVYRRLPVVRHDSWAPLAKIFYALEEVGELDRLHLAVYHSYHRDGLQINRETVIANWINKNSSESARFMASYRSATIQAKTDAARRMTIEYDVQAMPSFVVDGRYITSSNMTSSVMEVLSVVDELIVLARNKQLGQTDQQ